MSRLEGILEQAKTLILRIRLHAAYSLRIRRYTLRISCVYAAYTSKYAAYTLRIRRYTLRMRCVYAAGGRRRRAPQLRVAVAVAPPP